MDKDPNSYPSLTSEISRALESNQDHAINSPPSEGESTAAERRKAVGGLRLGPGSGPNEDDPNSIRQLQSDSRTFPKRRKINDERRALKPSTLDKLITSIWEQIHGSLQLDPRLVMEQWSEQRSIMNINAVMEPTSLSTTESQRFSKINILCRKVTQASRCCRSIEVIVQAHWIGSYDKRVRLLAEASPYLSLTKHKVAVLKEACEDFGWTEKDLRNKIAVWRGYSELQWAAGWAPLVFAGMGLYRYCKYRIDFSPEALSRLSQLRSAFEVAADTLHPSWRQLLSIVDISTEQRYSGHPHDWVVGDPIGAQVLKDTYLQWDDNFAFEHLNDCVIDENVWGNFDPRSLHSSSRSLTLAYFKCEKCEELQSDDLKDNCCSCYPNLYGGRRGSPPLQVFRTADGKNNGLVARCVSIFPTACGSED